MLYVLLALSVHLPAQHVDREISLQEVEVKAARVIRKADRQTIYPTEVQKNSSSSGYSILQKLALPNIRVDETSCSVSASTGEGPYSCVSTESSSGVMKCWLQILRL